MYIPVVTLLWSCCNGLWEIMWDNAPTMKLKWTTSVEQTIITWRLISQRVHYLFITRKIRLCNEVPERRQNSGGKAMGGQNVPASHLARLYLVIRILEFSSFKKKCFGCKFQLLKKIREEGNLFKTGGKKPKNPNLYTWKYFSLFSSTAFEF